MVFMIPVPAVTRVRAAIAISTALMANEMLFAVCRREDRFSTV